MSFFSLPNLSENLPSSSKINSKIEWFWCRNACVNFCHFLEREKIWHEKRIVDKSFTNMISHLWFFNPSSKSIKSNCRRARNYWKYSTAIAKRGAGFFRLDKGLSIWKRCSQTHLGRKWRELGIGVVRYAQNGIDDSAGYKRAKWIWWRPKDNSFGHFAIFARSAGRKFTRKFNGNRRGNRRKASYQYWNQGREFSTIAVRRISWKWF